MKKFSAESIQLSQMNQLLQKKLLEDQQKLANLRVKSKEKGPNLLKKP
jgi:hypothetical protein